MVVFHAVIVVNVGRGDALLERLERRPHARTQVSVARIKTDFEVQPRVVEERHQPFRRTQIVGNIFQQDLGAARPGEDFKVLERSKSSVKLAQVIGLLGQPDVDHQIAKRDLLGDFEHSLDLVHRIDAEAFLEVSDGNRQSSQAAPIGICKKRRVDRME